MKNTIETLIANLEEMAYNDYHITAGVERKVTTKEWEKDDKKRLYLNIDCYTLAGNYKGRYKAGYVDMVTGEYVATKYDDIDALNSEYIGR